MVVARLCFSIHVSTYNILASQLASNLRPWYWYGYRGMLPDGTYLGDELDSARLKAFGVGRSALLIDAWAQAKDYFKLFDTDGYDYQVHRLELYDGEEPSMVLRRQLARAIFDFFRRNDVNHLRGDRKLAYTLFDKDRSDFVTLDKAVLSPLGYTFTEEEWHQLDMAKKKIYEQMPSSPNRTAAIDAYNFLLSQFLVLRRRSLRQANNAHPQLHDFSLTKERVEMELHEVALEMATMLSLNNDDMRRLIEHQRQLDWPVRSGQIVREIEGMQCDLLGAQEVDRPDDLSKLLRRKLDLAAFKHRKVLSYDDGVALFYDRNKFELRRREDGGVCVAAIRYSSGAELRKKEGLSLRRLRLPYLAGVLGAEEESVENGSIYGDGLTPDASVDLWAWTDELRLRQQEAYDERVAVVALLRHVESGEDVLAVTTHLAHTQNKPHPEAMRAIQINQLEAALDAIRKTWSASAPTVLMMDGNDPPRLSAWEGRGEDHTPMYRALLQNGWTDCLGEDFGATSITLNRRVRIDYICVRSGDRFNVGSERQDALEVKLVGINEHGGKTLVDREEERSKAVYGLPLPEVGNQPAVPSDHLHVSAKLIFREKQKDVP